MLLKVAKMSFWPSNWWHCL